MKIGVASPAMGNVVVPIDVVLVVNATGRRIAEEDEVHIWHFDTKGRVIRFSAFPAA